MGIVHELYAISKRFCQLAYQTNWKHPDLRFSAHVAKKFTCQNSETSTSMEPTSALASLTCFSNIIQVLWSCHPRSTSTNQRSSDSTFMERGDLRISSLLMAQSSTLKTHSKALKRKSFKKNLRKATRRILRKYNLRSNQQLRLKEYSHQ